MSNKNLLMSFVTGAAAGAVLGILFAPTSGEKTRKKILKAKDQSVDYLGEMVEEGKKTWYKAKGKMESGAGIAAEEVDDFISHILATGQSWWKSTKNKAANLASEAKSKASDLASEAKSKASDLASEAKSVAQDAVNDGKKGVKEVTKEGQSAVNDIKAHFS